MTNTFSQVATNDFYRAVVSNQGDPKWGGLIDGLTVSFNESFYGPNLKGSLEYDDPVFDHFNVCNLAMEAGENFLQACRDRIDPAGDVGDRMAFYMLQYVDPFIIGTTLFTRWSRQRCDWHYDLNSTINLECITRYGFTYPPQMAILYSLLPADH